MSTHSAGGTIRLLVDGQIKGTLSDVTMETLMKEDVKDDK